MFQVRILDDGQWVDVGLPVATLEQAADICIVWGDKGWFAAPFAVAL